MYDELYTVSIFFEDKQLGYRNNVHYSSGERLIFGIVGTPKELTHWCGLHDARVISKARYSGRVEDPKYAYLLGSDNKLHQLPKGRTSKEWIKKHRKQ